MAARKKAVPPPPKTPWGIFTDAYDIKGLTQEEIERAQRVVEDIFDLGQDQGFERGHARGFVDAGVIGIRSDQ